MFKRRWDREGNEWTVSRSRNCRASARRRWYDDGTSLAVCVADIEIWLILVGRARIRGMAKLTKLERVAYHEAGHAVIAHVCGSRVKRATIKPEGDCLGRVIHSFPLGGDPESEMTAGMVDKIERRILFLFAGQSAEQQAAGRYNWVGGSRFSQRG